MNGWQRLWVLLGIPWVLYWIWGIGGLIYYIGQESLEDVYWTIGTIVVGWALVYVIGWMVAWVIRGFS